MLNSDYNRISVYVDGVLQARDDLAFTDTHVRLRHTPPQMSIVDIRTSDCVNSYTANGSNYTFRHNDGALSRRKIQRVMERALPLHTNEGVMDLIDKLDVMLRLLEE
jgi:hypothetical protein